MGLRRPYKSRRLSAREGRPIRLRLNESSSYDPLTGCLNWTKGLDWKGYSKIKLFGRTRRASRVALELKLKRQLTDTEYACHKCDNPRCISVAIKHVYLGDQKQNMSDRHDGWAPRTWGRHSRS